MWGCGGVGGSWCDGVMASRQRCWLNQVSNLVFQFTAVLPLLIDWLKFKCPPPLPPPLMADSFAISLRLCPLHPPPGRVPLA